MKGDLVYMVAHLVFLAAAISLLLVSIRRIERRAAAPVLWGFLLCIALELVYYAGGRAMRSVEFYGSSLDEASRQR